VAIPSIINIGSLSMNKFWGETERLRQPTATCTLLTLPDGSRLLADPSPMREELVSLLFARAGLRPAQVDLVFVTHWHGDHRFGLAAFPEARWLMAGAGLREWREQAPQDGAQIERFLEAERYLPDEVKLVATPGHTQGHHSLAVDTEWGRLLVAGDAVMTRDHLRTEEGHSNSVDFDEAAATIRVIKADYDWVVPGHDNYLWIGR
jgi:glyoxylase-like metal-dependent hydrolase (beta-lactamase superfamily II)